MAQGASGDPLSGGRCTPAHRSPSDSRSRRCGHISASSASRSRASSGTSIGSRSDAPAWVVTTHVPAASLAAARLACADRTSCPADVHSSASAGENPWLPQRTVSSSDRPSARHWSARAKVTRLRWQRTISSTAKPCASHSSAIDGRTPAYQAAVSGPTPRPRHATASSTSTSGASAIHCSMVASSHPNSVSALRVSPTQQWCPLRSARGAERLIGAMEGTERLACSDADYRHVGTPAGSL